MRNWVNPLGRNICSFTRRILFRSKSRFEIILLSSALASSLVLSEAFPPEVLSHGQEGLELLLADTDLTVEHEVYHRLDIGLAQPFQVQQRMVVRAAAYDVPEE